MIGLDPLLLKLGRSPAGTLLGRCRKEKFAFRSGKSDGSLIASLGHHVSDLCQLALQQDQCLSHQKVVGNVVNIVCYLRCPDCLADILSLQKDSSLLEF